MTPCAEPKSRALGRWTFCALYMRDLKQSSTKAGDSACKECCCRSAQMTAAVRHLSLQVPLQMHPLTKLAAAKGLFSTAWSCATQPTWNEDTVSKFLQHTSAANLWRWFLQFASCLQ
ncbi:hypothetical protein WJX74_007693 [Apatococcus lobatus]|uniref:Uncharacterized protein n=1 Tax=Apatococcus lobatus TaxID=904363 RepID=A0AAW1QGV2_9CHLO